MSLEQRSPLTLYPWMCSRVEVRMKVFGLEGPNLTLVCPVVSWWICKWSRVSRANLTFYPPFMHQGWLQNVELSNQFWNAFSIVSHGLAAPSQYIHRYSWSGERKSRRNEKSAGSSLCSCRCVKTFSLFIIQRLIINVPKMLLRLKPPKLSGVKYLKNPIIRQSFVFRWGLLPG